MIEIKINCEGCGRVHNVYRTPEIPDNVISLGCNWCPVCEDTAEDHYKEWYNYNEGENGEEVPELPNNPNQLVMPFIIEETLKSKEIA